MAAVLLKPGDFVITPSGRLARIDELRPDGRRDIRFIDLEGGEAALRPELLKLVATAPVVPWKTRVLR